MNESNSSKPKRRWSHLTPDRFLIALLAIGVLWKSELLIYFVVLTSAMSGLLRAFGNMDLGNTTISVSGLRWSYVVVVMGFVLLADVKRVRVPRYAWSPPTWTPIR